MTLPVCSTSAFQWLFFLLFLALPLAADMPAAMASARAALIIGNSSYATAPLPNPRNDATAMARELSGMGFRVNVFHDLSQDALYEAVDEFFAQAGESAEMVFFYAGHAVQVNGRNYLIPIDAPLNSSDLLSRLFDLRYLMDKLALSRNTRIRVVVLDACRNNPFSSHPLASSGLAEISAPAGSFIAFSTAPGKVAEDGEGDNSPYVTHLLRAISRPGSKIEDVFKEVRSGVIQATGGRQIPWEATSLQGDFYFVPPSAILAPASGTQATVTKTGHKPGSDTRNRCNQLMMKLSLGLEKISHEDQQLLRSACR